MAPVIPHARRSAPSVAGWSSKSLPQHRRRLRKPGTAGRSSRAPSAPTGTRSSSRRSSASRSRRERGAPPGRTSPRLGSAVRARRRCAGSPPAASTLPAPERRRHVRAHRLALPVGQRTVVTSPTPQSRQRVVGRRRLGRCLGAPPLRLAAADADLGPDHHTDPHGREALCVREADRDVLHPVERRGPQGGRAARRQVDVLIEMRRTGGVAEPRGRPVAGSPSRSGGGGTGRRATVEQERTRLWASAVRAQGPLSGSCLGEERVRSLNPPASLLPPSGLGCRTR